MTGRKRKCRKSMLETGRWKRTGKVNYMDDAAALQEAAVLGRRRGKHRQPPLPLCQLPMNARVKLRLPGPPQAHKKTEKSPTAAGNGPAAARLALLLQNELAPALS